MIKIRKLLSIEQLKEIQTRNDSADVLALLWEVRRLRKRAATAIKSEFVKMMTKPCKPEKPIGFGKSKPIGFGSRAAFENERTLSCVGFDKFVPPFPLSNDSTSVNNRPQ